MPTFTPQALDAVSLQILKALGAPDDLAQTVAGSLVGANLVGHDSHGVMQLPTYARWVREGKIQPAARPQIKVHEGATAQVDGEWGWGQVAARCATQTALELAAAFGVSAVTINHCNHIGRVGEYVETMAAAGVAGIVLCNTLAVVAPYGGRERLLGTNPLAWGAPGGSENEPLVLDCATSGIAEGNLRLLRARGERAPGGLIVDRAGRASREPADFYEGGALLPFGGYKGYGLSFMIELLGGALSGTAPSALPEYQLGNGTCILGIDIAAFVPLEQFKRQASALCEKIKSSAPAEGFREVLLPGEPEIAARRRRSAEGISIPDQTWSEIEALADALGVHV
jgi:LDH2 family malate/lactate/ureidoglycolate dehydrogenase